MSNSRSNIITPKVTRTNSIPSKTTQNNQLNKRRQVTNVVPPRKAKKEQQIKNNNQKIKVDYNSSNYFYSNENENNINSNNNEDEGYVEYYDNNQKSQKYNRETSDSYITVEQEDGNFKSVPNYYIEYNNKRNSPYYKKDDYDYYKENSEYDNEEGIENDEMYYENDEEYEQEEIDEHQSPKNNYRRYQNINNYYTTQNKNDNNNKKIKIQKVNQNVISRPIHHQINYPDDSKRKSRTSGRLNNYGNNSTTTNNTYNNNIYYINPINVKDKNIKEGSQRNKRQNKGKNSVYKNVDITINKHKRNNEKDFFRLHNIDKSQRIHYINSAIKIQSIFRGYLIKLKLFNNINLYVSLKEGINLLEKFFLRKKSFFWKKFKHYNDALINLDLLKHILMNNNTRNNSTDKKHIAFHKEIGDSFNIINKKDTPISL